MPHSAGRGQCGPDVGGYSGYVMCVPWATCWAPRSGISRPGPSAVWAQAPPIVHPSTPRTTPAHAAPPSIRAIAGEPPWILASMSSSAGANTAPARCLGNERLLHPAAIGPREPPPIVQPVRRALPDLDPRGLEVDAAQQSRARHVVGGGMAAAQALDLLQEARARRDDGRLGLVRRVVEIEQPGLVDLLPPVLGHACLRHRAEPTANPVLPPEGEPDQQELVPPGRQRRPLRAGLAHQEADPLRPDVAQHDRPDARRLAVHGRGEHAEIGERVTGRAGALPVPGERRDGILGGGTHGRDCSRYNRVGIRRAAHTAVRPRLRMTQRPQSGPTVEPGRRPRRHGGRALVAALALAGCVGLLPLPAPSADLSALRLPPGFSVDVFAHDLGPARFLALDPRGTLLVSVPRKGQVLALPDDDRDGRADRAVPVVEGLELPHGLAFHDGRLYVAETGRVVRLAYDPASHRARGAPEVVVPDLPARGSHWTRTIVFGPDGRLYVSIGSSCNNCVEKDPRRASIL